MGKAKNMKSRQSNFSPDETTIQTSVRLESSVHTDLKVIAAKEGISFNLLLEKIVKDYIKTHGKKI